MMILFKPLIRYTAYYHYYHQILGAVLIVIGAVVQASVAGPLHVAIFVIIIGGIIFIVAFFGCCGAIKEIRCMLLTVSLLAHHLLIDC